MGQFLIVSNGLVGLKVSKSAKRIPKVKIGRNHLRPNKTLPLPSDVLSKYPYLVSRKSSAILGT